jgi:hypothetical protein
MTVKTLRRFIIEDAAANSAGGGQVAGVKPGDDPVVYPSDQKRWRERAGDMFAGHKVFEADMDTLMKLRDHKVPPHRYDRYFSKRMKENGRAEEIRQYGRKNSRKNVVLKDAATGAMVFLRRPKARFSEDLVPRAALLQEGVSIDDLDKVIQQASALGMVLSVFNEHYSGSKFPVANEIQRATHKAILEQLGRALKEFQKMYKVSTR